MKSHLKRLATPKTWKINRKEKVFIVRPNPGAHSFERGLPLNVVLKELLKLVKTTREVKKVLKNNLVLVDGKRRENHHFLTGLFDVLSIPELKRSYRMLLNKRGKLQVKEISPEEGGFKPCKVVGKKVLTKGKTQLNLHDGKNIICKEQKVKVGDTLVLTLPQLEIKEILPLKAGANVFLIKGKHIGEVGILKEIKGREAVYLADNEEIETARDYLFVVGDKKPVINLGDK